MTTTLITVAQIVARLAGVGLDRPTGTFQEVVGELGW